MAEPKVSPEVIRLVSGILQRLTWSDHETRKEVERYGVSVLPVSFYSNVPSLQEVEESFEYTSQEPPYLDCGLFDRERLAGLLGELLPYAAEFDPPRQGDEETCTGYFWGNSQFSHSDAMSYYCFLRRLRPRTILEVGAGFSTLVALEAIRRNGAGRIVCVEPFPRPFLEHDPRLTLVREKAQHLDVGFFQDHLADGDVLFIDSTHTVKTGSDCLHLYLRILPRLGRDLVVHAHDVFLPFGLPIDWLRDRQIYWTEQYLLMALLLDNPRARVLFGSAYHQAYNRALLDRLMGGKWTSGGASFWFEYSGAAAIAAAPS